MIEPNAAVQLTDLSVALPDTVALNCSVAPVVAVADAGEIVTDDTDGCDGGGLDGAAVTVTLAAPDLLVSATLVAVTVSVPAFAGAVYWPAAVIVPSAAFQVTALLVVEPATLAVKGKVPPATEEAVAGDTVTEVTAGVDGGLDGGLFVGAAVTVIVAWPTLVGSATLDAVTIDVPALAGAV